MFAPLWSNTVEQNMGLASPKGATMLTSDAKNMCIMHRPCTLRGPVPALAAVAKWLATFFKAEWLSVLNTSAFHGEASPACWGMKGCTRDVMPARRVRALTF